MISSQWNLLHIFYCLALGAILLLVDQSQSHELEASVDGTCRVFDANGVCSNASSPKIPNTTSSSSTSYTLTSKSTLASSQCTLYLAPSTIPGAGLGIFTTTPRKVGETIGHGDVFLPLFEMDWHNDRPVHQREADDVVKFFDPFSNYVWNGHVMGMSEEVITDDIDAMCPGLDAAINCNLALINVGKALPKWDDGGLHRSKDPGAGALTLYHNGSTPIINRDITAGGELFKFYGDNWFETRPDRFSTIPLSEDYPRAQNLLDLFGQLVGFHNINHDDEDANSTSFQLPVHVQQDLWSLISHSPFVSRIINALPKKLEDAWLAIFDDLAALHQPHAIRSSEYLLEHGKCFDHIRPGRSTITQAGRGGFAVRSLQKGTIISGSPLLHLPHYHVFDMYEIYQNETTKDWDRGSTKIGKQLKLNYCFGHAQSTLLLCPYGAGVSYINHNQTLANVRVQWSRHGLTSQNDTWFQLTPEQMEWVYKPNLAFDYVALRDIEEGEELFMDYGDEFEKSWQDHVAHWKPPANSESYVSAHDFNFRMARTALRTKREQERMPYPDHLQVRCHSILSSEDTWRQHFPHNNLPKNHQYSMWSIDEKGYPCHILHRYYDGGVDYYNVHVYEPTEEDLETDYSRSHVPRSAISFVDTPYSTDMHLRNAFRHAMMIPDDMFPNTWRNVV